jgi:hypothetical protein
MSTVQIEGRTYQVRKMKVGDVKSVLTDHAGKEATVQEMIMIERATMIVRNGVPVSITTIEFDDLDFDHMMQIADVFRKLNQAMIEQFKANPT